MSKRTRVLLLDAVIDSFDTYASHEGAVARRRRRLRWPRKLPVEHSLLIPSIARHVASVQSALVADRESANLSR